MCDKNELLNSIKSSFQNALDIVTIKKDIDSEITDTIDLIRASTNDVVYAVIEKPEKTQNTPYYYSGLSRYDKIINLSSNANNEICYFLCAYSLNKSTGFPVVINYKNEEFSCNTIETLKLTLKNILTSPETAMAMANLFNGKDAEY